jgi:broad specificity phosphatase PhoE
LLNPLFFIVRHGATAGNKSNEYRGWSNAPYAQLSPEGREGVRESALWLKRSGQQFPMILSDDLDRTIETRDILADILGIQTREIDKRLKPLNVGDYTGQNKTDYPLDQFMQNTKMRIPGGESLDMFNRRQAVAFDDVSQIIAKLGKPILLVGHGSNVSFLYNHFNKDGHIGYEGLVNPGGILVFTSAGIIPLTNKREPGVKTPLKDGTATSGFVDEDSNRPPRECWNCKWASRDIYKNLGCTHPVVRIDPDLVDRRQADGTILVGDRDCCDSFQNKVSS